MYLVQSLYIALPYKVLYMISNFCAQPCRQYTVEKPVDFRGEKEANWFLIEADKNNYAFKEWFSKCQGFFVKQGLGGVQDEYF